MSSRVVKRPMERSASPTTVAVAVLSGAAARYFANATRASGVLIFPSAWAASFPTADTVLFSSNRSDSQPTASESFN
jgi:hypothetical protein